MNHDSNYDLFAFSEDYLYCPCPKRHRRRLEDNGNNDGETWEIVFTCIVLFIMFGLLVTDRLGADSIMLATLTAFMASEIITVQEGLIGFANQGVLTVLILFVVAEGISKTGALDWYMGKALGQPKTTAAAQLRLMIPISIVSAFLNNTPVVAVMIPIVQKWARNIRISQQQLLIPLSFASILGGTCTLIGTSTNLVVVGLLNERYTDISIGLFDLGQYGVPVAMAGMAYILFASPFLLPNSKKDNSNDLDAYEDILLGARLTQWSPAAGRTVQRSGLRDTGGIFLVSVHRAATGNVHRAVSNDFVLNVDDILYFTGLVESFGEFCQEHGLEVVTNETLTTNNNNSEHNNNQQQQQPNNNLLIAEETTPDNKNDEAPRLLEPDSNLAPVLEDTIDLPIKEIGVTKESLMEADEAERLRGINKMQDLIRDNKLAKTVERGGTKILVAMDKDLVVVGINAHDRPGLLLDIAKGLLRFHLQLHHTEAAVVADRSVSIWRCEAEDNLIPDIEEIWSVMNALLSDDSGIEAIKERGLRVIRAKVRKGSRLIGKTAKEVDFRNLYKAAIVAVQSNHTPNNMSLSDRIFEQNDSLVLQASDDSPLLQRPPIDFYKTIDNINNNNKDTTGTMPRTNSVGSFVRKLTGRKDSIDSNELVNNNNNNNNGSSGNLRIISNGSSGNLRMIEQENPPGETTSGEEDGFYIGMESNDETDEEAQIVNLRETLVEAEQTELTEAVWKDLQVIFPNEDNDQNEGGGIVTREFLTAMAVAENSQLAGKSAIQVGINKLPDIFLVSIDRPLFKHDEQQQQQTQQQARVKKRTVISGISDASSIDDDSFLGSIRTDNQVFQAIPIDEPLQSGDILWFSGPAFAVGDLRKIPGLVSYENEEVEKITGKVFDRRLVQAVISRNGPLVGKTVKEVRFRTRYGAAVIAVHREGKRVHEHPGKVKLHAGDVLLLEAGASFIAKSAEHDRAFALLAEVKDSAPPRLSLLVPALLIAAGMLIVFMADLTSLLVSALVASILMVSLGIISEQEARDAVNWEVYITIASAFGIGTALVNSGVADAIANFLVDVGTGMGIGDAGLVGSVYFATFLISNVVTNNAAAALLFPIAMNAAEQTGTDRILMSYSLMLGASASFMSPFGYTTNLLIYGPGGYKYTDFLKFGTPMQLVLLVLSTLYLSVIDPWWVSWIATGLVLVIVVLTRIGTSSVMSIFTRQKETKQESATVES